MNFTYWRARLLLLAWWSGLYLPPDRRVLEWQILPALAQSGNFRRVLFVGVRFYTRKYPRMFGRTELVTMDFDPRLRRYGAHEHVVDRMENIAQHFPAESLDAIIANGVFGWGLDEPAAANAALAASARVLRAGGLLILGINERRATTPKLAELESLQNFAPVIFPGFPAPRVVVATPFDEREHTFLFFRKRPA